MSCKEIKQTVLGQTKGGNLCWSQLTASNNIIPASITNSPVSSSRTTAAVRPAALDAFPLVYTARGENSSTCLKANIGMR